MNGSECPTREELNAHRGGTLPAAESQRLAAHIDNCVRCRAMFLGAEPETVARPPKTGSLDPDKTLPGYRKPDSSGAPADEKAKPLEAPPPTPPPTAREYSFLLPPQQDGEIGRLGNYRVIGVLGSGGMGIVFHAEDLTLQRAVALKVMKPDFPDHDDGAQRMMREARSMAAIRHEHLVTIYQAGQQGDVFYLAMELLQGESLDARIRRGPRLEPAEILALTREIAGGLAAVHAHGLIHRDIKPSNIWLESPAQRVKILDFGLARPLSTFNSTNLTQVGSILGTPAFMSPEQARGQPTDARSDLFSLGCVLYLMCTGKIPFEGETLIAQLTALAVDNPPPVHELNPKVSLSLSGLVTRLLSKTPESRPPSAETLIALLERIESGEAIPQLQKPAPLPKKPIAKSNTQVVRKSRAPKVLAGLFLLCVAGVFIAGYVDRAPSRSAQHNPQNSPPAARDVPELPVATISALIKNHLQRIEKPGGVFAIDLPTQGLVSVNFPVESGKPGNPNPRMPPDAFRQFSVLGRISPHAMGQHPSRRTATASFMLGKKFRMFSALVSQNDGLPPASSAMIFSVIADGKLLWESAPLSSPYEAQRVEVSVVDAETLTLEVRCTGEPRAAHAIWFEPFLEK